MQPSTVQRLGKRGMVGTKSSCALPGRPTSFTCWPWHKSNCARAQWNARVALVEKMFTGTLTSLHQRQRRTLQVFFAGGRGGSRRAEDGHGRRGQTAQGAEPWQVTASFESVVVRCSTCTSPACGPEPRCKVVQGHARSCACGNAAARVC